MAVWEIADAVRAGRVSPLEILETHLARIDKLNPSLNAFVEVDTERARAAAREHSCEGPLAGVPITIKSSIDVAGLPVSCGSRLRANS